MRVCPPVERPGTILREWGRIGVLGFGGPPAHIALLRELCVDKRGWLDAREFEDANAACGLLPGPASTQMAIYCAQRAGGRRGAILGGLAFVLPGLVAMLAIVAVTLGEDPAEWIRGLGAGAGAAVIAVIVHTGYELARASLAERRAARLWRALAYLAIGAAAAALVGVLVVLALLGCGLLELALRRPRRAAPPRPPRAAIPGAVGAVLLAATGAAALPALAWTAFKVGALSYGGGFVIIPLMQADAVDAYGWMTEREFLDTVAYGQITPGPVTHTVAGVGFAAAGLGGGLLAAAIAFAPSFLIVGLGGERFARLRENASARAFLDGAGPAATGAILGAAVPIAEAISEPWQAGVAVAAALALFAAGRTALQMLLAGAALGITAALAGLDVPT